MRVLVEKPPIYAEAKKRFEIDDTCTVYAWGDIIYNPAGVEIGRQILVHEETHQIQQANHDGGPEKWWGRYLEDAEFRTEQEIQAYGEQYLYFCTVNGDRNAQFRYSLALGKILASPMYGADMSSLEAAKAIREWMEFRHLRPEIEDRPDYPTAPWTLPHSPTAPNQAV